MYGAYDPISQSVVFASPHKERVKASISKSNEHLRLLYKDRFWFWHFEDTKEMLKPVMIKKDTR